MSDAKKDRQREYSKRWYEKNAKSHKEQVRRRKQALRDEFYAYKRTKSCIQCKEDDIACLEFHHIDPKTKDGDPGMMVGRKSWTTEKLISYLESTCIVLCSNCHKKVHRDLKQMAKAQKKTAA